MAKSSQTDILSDSTIENVAKLAKLNIKPQDIAAYQKDMQNILQLIDDMAACDTSDVKPLASALDMSTPLREDQVTESDQRELLQQSAQKTKAGLYLVNKVIEGGE